MSEQTCEKDNEKVEQETVKKRKNEKPDKAELNALTEELAKHKELLLRTAAEYDNYRKRSEKEKQGSVEFGVCNAVSALLPAVDNLERAAEAETADADYKKGVEMTLKLFRDALASLGITEIAALGEQFNPEYHAAVAQLPQDGAESGTITAVVQKGYIKGSRVVRHAMVAVAP